MKTTFLLAILGCCLVSSAQQSEFGVYNNGLIYSEQAMGKLKHIVDSLNLKFKVCDVNKKYYSVSQGKVHYINLEKKEVRRAKEDIDKGISYAEFKSKYSKARFEEHLVATRQPYVGYNGKNAVSINTLELGDFDNHYMDFNTAEEMESLNKPLKGKWIYRYDEKTKWSDESLTAFYFVDDFAEKTIPQKYSRWIQYSDCLIDTTAQVFRKTAIETGVRYYDSIPNKARKFNDYVIKVLKRPDFPNEKFDVLFGMDTMFYPGEKASRQSKKQKAARAELQKQVEADYQVFSDKMQKWHAVRLSRIDSLRLADPNFMPLLISAHADATATKKSDDEFEEYVGIYISKDAELELKRNRRVIGGCSMDSAPRTHAFNIALLSAETTKWEIFLRSHLDIMNDRFDRVSDGSYAQKGRETYIKELETLDINVLDLILGISLRIENAADNHYFASIGRTGRALSESKNGKELESLLLEMIADQELDDFNRVLMFYLFDNYNHFLADENVRNANVARLKLAVATLPEHISGKIKFEKS
jgi:hypothetical protein